MNSFLLLFNMFIQVVKCKLMWKKLSPCLPVGLKNFFCISLLKSSLLLLLYLFTFSV